MIELLDYCNRILYLFTRFASTALDFFFTEVEVLGLIITPLELMTTFFFGFVVARIALNAIPG